MWQMFVFLYFANQIKEKMHHCNNLVHFGHIQIISKTNI